MQAQTLSYAAHQHHRKNSHRQQPKKQLIQIRYWFSRKNFSPSLVLIGVVQDMMTSPCRRHMPMSIKATAALCPKARRARHRRKREGKGKAGSLCGESSHDLGDDWWTISS